MIPMAFSRIRSRWLGDRSGSVVVEFALVVPILLTLLLGAVETVNLLRVDSKVQNVAFATGDLITQKKDLSNARLTDILVRSI